MVGWLIAFAVIFLLAILPLGGCVIYNEDGVLVKIIAGPIRITVFPGKQKKTEIPNEAPKKVKKSSQKPQKQNKQVKKSPSKKGGSILDFLPLVKLAIRFLGDFRKKLRLDRLEMNLVMAGGDPCDLAVNYGRAWAALGNLLPLLERVFVIKKRDLNVGCDFVADKTLIYARLDITITLGRLIALLVCYGVRALIRFVKIMNKRKGGANV